MKLLSVKGTISELVLNRSASEDGEALPNDWSLTYDGVCRFGLKPKTDKTTGKDKLVVNYYAGEGGYGEFNATNEMTRPQKIYASFLNKLWCAWLQSRGHKVIPNISFPDEWQEDYWREGWPKHSVIAISSVGVLSHGNPTEWLKAVKRIREVLQPIHILRYDPKIPGENEENCTYFCKLLQTRLIASSAPCPINSRLTFPAKGHKRG